jgi:type II secretory pathway component GspD/PulD (secretin)
MNSRKVLLLTVVVALASTGWSEEPNQLESSSLMDAFKQGSWATVSSGTSGFTIRLLSEEQKQQVEKTIGEYIKLRADGDDADEMRRLRVTEAYRTLASDARYAQFSKVISAGRDYVELKGDQFHALIPKSSINAVMLGPNGFIRSAASRAARSRVGGSPPEDVIRALRGGGRGAPPVRPDGAAAAKAKRVAVFFLKNVKSEEALKVIQSVYEKEEGLRVSTDARVNSVIVQADDKLMKAVEALLKELDAKPAEVPPLR